MNLGQHRDTMPPSSRAVAPAVAAASVLALAGTRLLYRKRISKVGQTTKRILVYNVARFICCLTLLGISVTSPILRAPDLRLHNLAPTSFLPAAVFVSFCICKSLSDSCFNLVIRNHSRVLHSAFQKSMDSHIPSQHCIVGTAWCLHLSRCIPTGHVRESAARC